MVKRSPQILVSEDKATTTTKKTPQGDHPQQESVNGTTVAVDSTAADDIIEKYVPTKTSSTKHHQSWINNKLKRQPGCKYRAWKRAKQPIRQRTGHDLRPSRKKPER